MKKKSIFFTLIFLTNLFLIFSKPLYNNPFWSHGVTYKKIEKVNPFVLTHPQIIGDFSVPIDYANGIYFGAFYQLGGEFRISKIFNFEATIKLGVNVPSINTISISWVAYPISYLRLSTNYKFRNFFQYSISEHNLSFLVTGLFDFPKMPKWLDIEFTTGLNIRFIDLDIRNNEVVYKQDWLSEFFFMWQYKMMFHPVFVYSLGLSFGNYDRYVVYTANYWQVEFHNYFHLPKSFSIFIDGGFSFSGALAFAGIINRGWGKIGVRYGFNEI